MMYCIELISFNHAIKDDKQRMSIQTVNGMIRRLIFKEVDTDEVQEKSQKITIRESCCNIRQPDAD